MPTLTIDRLTHVYPSGVKALDAVSLEIPQGLYGLLGPNGAGKSTLMRTVATLQTPTSGAVRFDGIVREGEPTALIAALKGRIWTKAIDREELEACRARHEVISTRWLAGRTVAHVLADEDPDHRAVLSDLRGPVFLHGGGLRRQCDRATTTPALAPSFEPHRSARSNTCMGASAAHLLNGRRHLYLLS